MCSQKAGRGLQGAQGHKGMHPRGQAAHGRWPCSSIAADSAWGQRLVNCGLQPDSAPAWFCGHHHCNRTALFPHTYLVVGRSVTPKSPKYVLSGALQEMLAD